MFPVPVLQQKEGWRERKMKGGQKRKREEAIKKFLFSWTNGLFHRGSLPRPGDNGADVQQNFLKFLNHSFLFLFCLLSYLKPTCANFLFPLFHSFFSIHLSLPLPLSIPHFFPERLVHRHLPVERNPLSVYSPLGE